MNPANQMTIEYFENFLKGLEGDELPVKPVNKERVLFLRDLAHDIVESENGK